MMRRQLIVAAWTCIQSGIAGDASLNFNLIHSLDVVLTRHQRRLNIWLLASLRGRTYRVGMDPAARPA